MDKVKVKINFVDFGHFEHNTDVVKMFTNNFVSIINTFATVEISDDPDFLICCVYGSDHWKYDCVKILYNTEELEADFSVYDYAIGMSDLIMYDRYFCEPQYLSVRFKNHTLNAMKKHELSEEFFTGKKKFCNFIFSNGDADKFREETFHALNAYKSVDSAGKFLNNMENNTIAGERFSGNWEESKIEFMKDYRFTIAFGNAQKYGYTDEKIFDAWSAGTIPIFWGDPKLKDYFNTKAYIDCCDCKTAAEVVEKVREIEESPEKYLAMQKEPIVQIGGKWEKYILDNISKKDLTAFLKNIMLQKPQEARRVSNGIAVRLYQRDLKTLDTLKQKFIYRLYRKFAVPKKQSFIDRGPNK